MPSDTDRFDVFVSYARADDAGGWITRFVEELLAEHARFTGGPHSLFFSPEAPRGAKEPSAHASLLSPHSGAQEKKGVGGPPAFPRTYVRG